MAYGPPAPGDPTLAEWWQRLVARLVDGLVVSAVTSPLLIWYITWYMRQLPAFLPADSDTPPPVDDLLRAEMRLFGVSLLIGLAGAVVAFVYDAFAHARWGQTVGKRAMKIKVVMLSGRGPITGGTACKRAAVYVLAPQIPLVGSIIGLLNVLWLLWDKPFRQCLHDKAAHTVVVKTHLP